MALDYTTIRDDGHRAPQKSFAEIVGESGDMNFLRFFGSDVSTRASEVYVGMGDIAYLQARAGAVVAEIDWKEGFKTTLEHVDYTGTVTIERKDAEDMPMEIMDQFNQSLATAVASTMSRDAYNVLNRAFNGAYLGGDAKSLCADDHPQQPGSGVVWDNKATAALSAASYEAARAAMMNQLTPSGRKATWGGPQFMIVPPALRRTAQQLTGSLVLGVYSGVAGEIDLANNPVVSDGLQVIESNELASATDWFLARRSSPRSGLVFILRSAPEIWNGITDVLHDPYYTARVRFSAGFTSGRQIFGSDV